MSQVMGDSDNHACGRILLALLRRRMRDGQVSLEATVKHAREIGFDGSLTDEENYRIDALVDLMWHVIDGTYYCSLDDVRHEVTEFLEDYAEFDGHIP